MAAVRAFGGGPSQGGFQGKDPVRWLGVGDWQLRGDESEPYLVLRPLPREDRLTERHCWAVSAPTIKAEAGKFLAYDLKGREPRVYLTREKGDHARWLFEVGERLRPGPKKKSSFKEGREGFTFKAIAAEGEFKGWYLAAEDAPKTEKDKKPAARKRLTLVRQAEKATLFSYVETNYFEDHK